MTFLDKKTNKDRKVWASPNGEPSTLLTESLVLNYEGWRSCLTLTNDLGMCSTNNY